MTPAFRHGASPVESLARLVGNTPLVRLRHVGSDISGVRVYVKCEFMNPGGSVKDRAALRMIETALADGRFGSERTLVDSTSGNTGVAYAWICAALGLRCALVMPANVSPARKQIARAFGAELVFSSPLDGSDGAIRKVRELVAADPDRWFYPDQYGNPENPRAHEHGTAVEIVEALDGQVAAFAVAAERGCPAHVVLSLAKMAFARESLTICPEAGTLPPFNASTPQGDDRRSALRVPLAPGTDS